MTIKPEVESSYLVSVLQIDYYVKIVPLKFIYCQQ